MPAAPSGSNATASDVVDVAVDVGCTRDATRVQARTRGHQVHGGAVLSKQRRGAGGVRRASQAFGGGYERICANVDAVVREIPLDHLAFRTFGMERFGDR